MKVLVAGASGAIGTPLTRRLIARGHEVLGLVRDPAGADPLAALGATPVVANALDRDELLRAVHGFTADAVVHELTALRTPPRAFSGMVPTNRLRVEGTANLLAAADALGARRFVTQSIILGYGYFDHGPEILTEAAPFGGSAGTRSDAVVAAIRATEEQTFSAPEGIAVRYGLFYGGDAASQRALLVRRRIPVAAGGLLGWVHHDDAAAATVAALERGRAGEAYNVVDDRPASWREVYTAMAEAFAAPPPRHVPGWLFRLVAPYVASFAVDTSMRVSNAKARAELEWVPRFSSYVEGLDATIHTIPHREAITRRF